ncbi:MAG: hypothetical protein N3A72_12285, partial [bacterium]|nr:hypothetical protein [bacterium]
MKKIAIFVVGTFFYFSINNLAFSIAPFSSSDTTITITYIVKGEVHKFTRFLPRPPANEQEKIIAILKKFIQGPNVTELKKGIKSAVPSQTRITKIEVGKNNHIFFHLRIPKKNLNQLTVTRCDDFYDSLSKTLYGIATSYSVTVLVLDEVSGQYKPLSDFLPPLPPQPKKPDQEQPESKKSIPPIKEAQGYPAGYGQGQPTGALTGKTVFISPGHGWYYDGGTYSNSTWKTQR